MHLKDLGYALRPLGSAHSGPAPSSHVSQPAYARGVSQPAYARGISQPSSRVSQPAYAQGVSQPSSSVSQPAYARGVSQPSSRVSAASLCLGRLSALLTHLSGQPVPRRLSILLTRLSALLTCPTASLCPGRLSALLVRLSGQPMPGTSLNPPQMSQRPAYAWDVSQPSSRVSAASLCPGLLSHKASVSLRQCPCSARPSGPWEARSDTRVLYTRLISALCPVSDDSLKDMAICPDGKKPDDEMAVVCGFLSVCRRPAVKRGICTWKHDKELLTREPAASGSQLHCPPAGGLDLEPGSTA